MFSVFRHRATLGYRLPLCISALMTRLQKLYFHSLPRSSFRMACGKNTAIATIAVTVGRTRVQKAEHFEGLKHVKKD
jgi:hypothetical protein